MDGSGGGSWLRGRRLESCLEASVWSRGPAKPRPEDAVGQRSPRPAAAADFVDDDRWITVILSVVRIVVCFLSMAVTTALWAVIMLLLLPWPYARIRQGNLYGHVTGRMLMWILGNPITIEGSEFSNTRAIYICNHASPLDIFLVMWLTPTGTVGIAKKEIIWYPLFGQLYVLANHLRIDRSNPTAAIESIKEVARAVVQKNLSLIIFPEGTRSKTGRLLPFKKGFVHIALQTRLPIVPMVLTGTHLAWRKNSLRVRPAPLTVKYLPPIKTDDWEAEKMDDYVEMIHALFVDHLPESQKPLVSDGRDVSRRSNS
uniref:1-acyl-sn-glycerol-3-phosphate acyltransferase n=1 Tax=Elaeis guineensis var. tenera TaxID=51953 RepID=A0A8N4IFT3_ELAGV|nr:1-acyl-sn-glycerol-3-phosphate acyltransferase isoform X1 [Elaeis guineensis]